MASTEGLEIHVEADHQSPASSPIASPSPAVNGHKDEEEEGAPKELTIDVSGAAELTKAASDTTAGDAGEMANSISEAPKSSADSGPGAENGSHLSSSSTNNASPSPSPSDSKIKKARNKFEHTGSFDKKSGKRKEKVKYAGLCSAKNRFMDAASADDRKPVEKRKPKRITPPRDGNLTGVVESQPAERDPNVVRSDMFAEDDLPTSASAKSAMERFREMERKSSTSEGDDRRLSGKVEVDAAVTKNLMSVWKTRETQEPEKKERKSQIRIREEVEGGVYENQPQVLADVVRANDQPVEELPGNLDTRARRDEFLRQAGESSRTNKLNALEEISELARREQNIVFENRPAAPTEGVVRGTYEDDRQEALNVSTKELRQRFLNSEDRAAVQRQQVQLDLAEGGVFENEPIRRDDVVRGDEASEDLLMAENSVKSSLQRLQELKEQASRVQTSKAPVILAEESGTGVFENVPESSKADYSAAQMMEVEEKAEGKFASDAKKAFLQRQAEEEAVRKKEAPKMIDIWSDLCKDSGVFENKPVERDPNIIRELSDDEVDEEGDEEEEEEEEAGEEEKKEE